MSHGPVFARVTSKGASRFVGKSTAAPPLSNVALATLGPKFMDTIDTGLVNDPGFRLKPLIFSFVEQFENQFPEAPMKPLPIDVAVPADVPVNRSVRFLSVTKFTPPPLPAAA